MARKPRRITAPYLQRITSHYLERYTSCRSNLRRLLVKRVHRSAAHHEVDPEPWLALVELELDRLERVGLLNDSAYARDRARSLHRRGSGARKIRATLQAKGVSSTHIDEALEALASEGEDPELVAACTYARKRRIGPWRTRPADDDQRRRELARLARAGFPFDLARRIIHAESIEAIEPP
ncbi:MAG TPA: regulatory protein RecX [Deltaproteobacteria bacterium]|nr:regulatory protein RecX [Deltaproteobacteria bacterium]